MKRVWMTEDGETFHSKKDAEAYEKNCKPPIAIPWELFKEILRQCSPYLVRARDRYALRDELVKIMPKALRPRGFASAQFPIYDSED